MDSIHQARLAQSVEHQTLNRRVVGSSPTVEEIFHFVFCRFRRAPGRSASPMQMKSSITSIRVIYVHRDGIQRTYMICRGIYHYAFLKD